MPFGQETYGTPMRQIAGQALQFKAGLGALQEQQRQQQAMAELDAAWKQAGGDPAKFKEMGGYRFLSPQQAMQLEAKLQEKADKDKARAGFETFTRAANPMPGMPATGGPSVENARLMDQQEAVRAKRNVAMGLYDAGYGKEYLKAQLEDPNGVGGGRGAAIERLMRLRKEYRERLANGEELTPWEQEELRDADAYIVKLGNWSPTPLSKYAEEIPVLTARANDPNTPPEERAQLAKMLSDHWAKQAKGGQYLVSETAPDGSVTQSVIPVPNAGPAIGGQPVSGVGQAGGQAEAGVPVGRKPPKALSATLQDDMAQFSQTVDLLNSMKAAVQKDAGWVSGGKAYLQTYAPDVFGENRAAEEYYATLPAFRLSLQAAVKGIPSDKDMDTVTQGLPGLFGPRGLNVTKWNRIMHDVGKHIAYSVQFNEGKGVFVPPFYRQMANRFLKGEFDIIKREDQGTPEGTKPSSRFKILNVAE